MVSRNGVVVGNMVTGHMVGVLKALGKIQQAKKGHKSMECSGKKVNRIITHPQVVPPSYYCRGKDWE